MRIVSLLVLLCLHVSAWSLPMSPDTLLSRLRDDGAEEFIRAYENEITTGIAQKTGSDVDVNLRVGLLAVAYDATGDSVRYGNMTDWITDHVVAGDQRQEMLQFLFNHAGEFISQRTVYLSVQHLGMQLADAWNEPRVQFAFLENCMGLALFSKNADEKASLIAQMKTLGSGYPYLELRTTYHQAEYYLSLHNDSCVYFFESFIDGIKPMLGKENPYFLQETNWIQKVDSGLLANAYRSYGVHSMAKGEIKKAGQLLVLADQMIPDTSVYDVRKIEIQISLSSLYADLVNKEKTLEYARKAVERCERYQYTKLRSGRVASAYARALMVNGKFAEAAFEYEKAYTYQISGLSKIDPKRQALYLSILSTYLPDLDKASLWLHKAEAISVEPNAEIQFLIATAYGLTSMYGPKQGAALSHLLEANSLAEKTNNVRWLRESLYHLYLFYKLGGRLAESLASYEKFVHVNDSLYRSGQELALFDIEAGYQKSLQDETIARLDVENEIATARLKAQKRNLIVLLSGLLLVSMLLAVVWQLYRKVNESNTIISKAIEEKNILLREIHHRVKNNLQVISSLLKLQSGYIKDDAAIQAIAEGRSRVQSMALLHQNLYKEDNLTGVNMKEYFDNLIQGLFDTYNISPERIVLHKNIAEINLDVDTVVPLGLITNELISNALKHAFPGTHAGNLFVDLFEEAGNLILKVRDDGIGMTKAASQEGFGSKLIHSLSQKLEADITTRTSHGTEVMLTIREYKKAA